MIVNCPECSTGFKLDESKVPEDGAWVRCGKCQHVFEVGGEGPADEPAAEAVPPAPEPKPKADEPEVDFDREMASAAASRGGGAFRAIFWIVGLLLLAALVGIGGLLVMDRMGLGPNIVAGARKLPVLGSILDAVRVSEPEETPAERAKAMTLAGVRGFFRINDKAGRIFIIQGSVGNNQGKPQTAIRVRGQLRDGSGKVVRSEVVYAGATFTPEQLRQMSPDDIKAKLAQPTGPDGSPYVLMPGKPIPFLILFTDLPGNLTEFTADLVGSEVYKPRAGTAGAR